MAISKKNRFRYVEPAERGFEIVKLIKEKGENFALVKIRLEDVGKLAVLKTDKERREYQRKAQRRYRERLASRQHIN